MKRISIPRLLFQIPAGTALRRRAKHWVMISLVLLHILPAFTQSPQQQTPVQKDRSLDVVDSSKDPRQSQNKPQEEPPELVLQTGYTALSFVQTITFSPDGRLLATTVLNSNQVKFWDIKSGLELRTLTITGGTSTIGPANLSGISSAAFSSDSRLFAAGGRDNSIVVWDVATGTEINHFAGPVGTLASGLGAQMLLFTRDSKQLVSISDAFRSWDLANGQKVVEKPFDFPVISGFGFNNPALSPDGSQVAVFISSDSSGSGRTAGVFDIGTGREVRHFDVPGDFSAVGSCFLSYTPAGRLVAAALDPVDDNPDHGERVKYCDLTGGSKSMLLGTVDGSHQLQPMSISPDGNLLALGAGLKARIWNLKSGAEMPPLTVATAPQLGQPDNVTALAFSPDSRLLTTGLLNAPISVWEVESGQQTATLNGHTNYATNVAFSPDGLHMTSGTKTIWDLGAGLGLRATSQQDGFGTLSRDGRLMATSLMSDNKVDLFDVAKGQKLFTLIPAERDIVSHQPVFSPDGTIVATMYRKSDQEARAQAPAIDQATARQMSKDMLKQMQKNPGAAIQTYQNMIASQITSRVGIAGQVKLWDTSTGRELRTLSVPPASPFLPGQVSDVFFSVDGKYVVTTVSLGDSVALWDVKTGAMIRQFGAAPQNTNAGPGAAMMQIIPSAILGGGNVITAVAFSADGKVMATGGREGKTDFDPAAIMAQATSAGKKGPKQPNYNGIARDALTNTHVTTTGPIKLWDLASGREIRTLSGHSTEVRALALAPDAKIMASAAADDEIKLWDLSTGQATRTLKGHSSKVNSVAFNQDGTILASSSDDGATILWDVATGNQLATLVSLFDGSEWLVVTPDGLFDGSPGSFNQILWRYNKNTFNVAPVEWFFKDFFYPGLLAELMSGKRPVAPRNIDQLDRRPPGIKLTLMDAPQDKLPLKQRVQHIRVEITNADAGARDVRLFRNGLLIKVWHGDARAGQVFDAEVPIIAGRNKMTAYAFNRDNVKSADAALSIIGDDSLKRPGVLYVLAIGVNNYSNPAYNLRYAVADAGDFGSEIERQQLKVGGYASVKIVPLLDQDATRANVLNALGRLSGQAGTDFTSPVPAVLESLKQTQPEDAVLVFFAGHGTAQKQRFYLIPHDLGYDGPRNSLDAAGLNTILAHSISDAELETAFENIDASQLVLVVDACNSGQALEAEEKRRGPMNSKGLAQLAYEKGMYVLTAAQSFQAAQEVAKVGHGLLTFALIEEGLKQMAADTDPHDEKIVAREWLNYATDRVPQIQIEKLSEAHVAGRSLSFGLDDNPAGVVKYVQQRPRVFYRREREEQPLIVAKD